MRLQVITFSTQRSVEHLHSKVMVASRLLLIAAMCPLHAATLYASYMGRIICVLADVHVVRQFVATTVSFLQF
jgi:hypothetical protein